MAGLIAGRVSRDGVGLAGGRVTGLRIRRNVWPDGVINGLVVAMTVVVVVAMVVVRMAVVRSVSVVPVMGLGRQIGSKDDRDSRDDAQ